MVLHNLIQYVFDKNTYQYTPFIISTQMWYGSYIYTIILNCIQPVQIIWMIRYYNIPQTNWSKQSIAFFHTTLLWHQWMPFIYSKFQFEIIICSSAIICIVVTSYAQYRYQFNHRSLFSILILIHLIIYHLHIQSSSIFCFSII